MYKILFVQLLFFNFCHPFSLLMAQEKTPESIQDTTLIEDTIDLKIANTSVKILTYQRGKANGELYFNMHDDENTSVIAAKKIIDKHGGKLATLSHSGKRLIVFSIAGIQYKIDPNRIFTKIGIEKTLKRYGPYSTAAQEEVERFSNKLIDTLLSESKLIIAMHNNFNTPSFSAKSYAPGGNMQNEVVAAYLNPRMGTGDFFYCIEKAHFEHFKKNLVSAVLQDNDKVTDDGSLSVYCAQQGISYINSEAQRGHLNAQVSMLEELVKILPSQETEE